MDSIESRTLAELCRELEHAENVAGERIGGPSEDDMGRINALEAAIGDRPADSMAVVLFRARRLARAVLNDWRHDLLEPLALALERDTEAFGA